MQVGKPNELLYALQPYIKAKFMDPFARLIGYKTSTLLVLNSFQGSDGNRSNSRIGKKRSTEFCLLPRSN